MVSVLAFYPDDPSFNPAEAYSFSVKFVFEKNENKQKEVAVGPFFKEKLMVLRVVVKAKYTSHWQFLRKLLLT